MAEHEITLTPAVENDKNTLSRLLRDYAIELLPYGNNPQEEVQDYKYLPDYFTDPERSAFLIKVSNEVAGFVLVNTHTLMEPQAHSIAEFYVVPAFRHDGVGRDAAVLAFKKFPGRWEVAQMKANQPAIAFWRRIINEATSGQYHEVMLDSEDWCGPVQTFSIC